MTGNASYLAEGLRWCDAFSAQRRFIVPGDTPPPGYKGAYYWDSGYSTIYFGDTGTAHQALALCALSLPLGNPRRAKYIDSMKGYRNFVMFGCKHTSRPPALYTGGTLEEKAFAMRKAGPWVCTMQLQGLGQVRKPFRRIEFKNKNKNTPNVMPERPRVAGFTLAEHTICFAPRFKKGVDNAPG